MTTLQSFLFILYLLTFHKQLTNIYIYKYTTKFTKTIINLHILCAPFEGSLLVCLFLSSHSKEHFLKPVTSVHPVPSVTRPDPVPVRRRLCAFVAGFHCKKRRKINMGYVGPCNELPNLYLLPYSK